MLLFLFFFLAIVSMRLLELLIAKRNERALKAMGAKEFGEGHYRWIVAMHGLFLVSFLGESLYKGADASPWWSLLFPLFLAVQALRVWAIASLGTFWNTKILVLPHARVIAKGPYRVLRHPNYLAVALEILLIPLLFEAYVTAAVFSVWNAYMLSVRIAMEERALASITNYDEQFRNRPRLFPFLPAK